MFPGGTLNCVGVPKTHQFTVSILLMVFNDIFTAMDSVLLVFLNLTSAFDAVYHEILISRFRQWVGTVESTLK